jgi:hypothetical protein
LASTPLAAATASNLSELAPPDEMLDCLCSEFVSPDAPGKPNSKFNNEPNNPDFYGQSKHNHNKGCVTMWPCHFYIKKYLKAKEELWKLKYFTMQKYNLQKVL